MNKEIERLQGHTVVCGFGRMGTILASDLAKAGKPFVVIDSDPLRIKEAEDRDYLVIHGDATEEYVLQHAGTRRASVLATVLSADATNVFITLTAREMNPDVMIIARGENPRTGKKLQSCGADKVVLPTAIGASKIAQLIVRPTAESMLEQVANRAGLNEELGGIGLSFNEIKVAEKSPLVNRPLRDIEVRSNHGFLIVAIRQGDAAPTLNPSGDTVMAAGDVVIVLGHQNDIPSLAEKLASQAKPLIYRGVTLNP